MRDMDVNDEFEQRGGTELALMSTTSNRAVAEEYATRGAPSFSLLFQVHVHNHLLCGADISFASCFPDEVEFVYPPNTLLETTKKHYSTAAGLARGSSRGGGMAAGKGATAVGQAAGQAAGSAQLKVVEVVPTFRC